MSDFLSAVFTRLDAILQSGRGVTGLGSEVAARAIPAGTFRQAADNAPLDDPQYPAEAFDCGYSVRVTRAQSDPAPNNPYSSVQFDAIDLTISVGYVETDANVGFVYLRGAEVAATEVRRADRRAASDAMRIKRALQFQPLWGSDTDPVVVECTGIDYTLQPLGGGRLVGVSRFRLVVQWVGTSAYGP